MSIKLAAIRTRGRFAAKRRSDAFHCDYSASAVAREESADGDIPSVSRRWFYRRLQRLQKTLGIVGHSRVSSHSGVHEKHYRLTPFMDIIFAPTGEEDHPVLRPQATHLSSNGPKRRKPRTSYILRTTGVKAATDRRR